MIPVGLLGEVLRVVLLRGVSVLELTLVSTSPRGCCSNPAWCNGFMWFTGVLDHLYPHQTLSSGSVRP